MYHSFKEKISYKFVQCERVTNHEQRNKYIGTFTGQNRNSSKENDNRLICPTYLYRVFRVELKYSNLENCNSIFRIH